ncbi:MAG TPA: hypothetical protein VMU94_09245 [Streptosporangiaceae bacterium]|nr:hypothetical protein [Streptosporangiaceae bacterium]
MSRDQADGLLVGGRCGWQVYGGVEISRASAFCGCGAVFLAAGPGFGARLLDECVNDIAGQVGHCFQHHGQFIGSEFRAAGGAGA